MQCKIPLTLGRMTFFCSEEKHEARQEHRYTIPGLPESIRRRVEAREVRVHMEEWAEDGRACEWIECFVGESCKQEHVTLYVPSPPATEKEKA